MDTLQVQQILSDTLKNLKTVYLVSYKGNDLIDYLNLILLLLGLLFTYYKLKKEIHSSRRVIILNRNLENINKINELMGSLTFELESETYTKIYDGLHASENHAKIEATLLGILDNNITIQKNFADCLTRYRNGHLRSVPEWIVEIKTLKDRVCEELKNNE